MKQLFTTMTLAFLLCGCSNPVEEAKKEISEGAYPFLSPQIELINSTIDFVIYSDPKNYWFQGDDRNETQSVVNKLQSLIEMASEFKYNDYYMMEAKENLLASAKESQNNIIKSYNNSATSDYWSYQFFGELGLMANRRVDGVPKKLKTTINKMDSVSRARYFYTLPEMIFQLEKEAIGKNKISIEQYKNIRTYTLQNIKDSLMTNIYCDNQEWKNDLIGNIMTAFSDQYPVNKAYDYIVANQKYSGLLLQFIASTNDSYSSYDNILPGDCNWGYIFMSSNDDVIYRFECFGADSIDYKIGTIKEAKDKVVCQFKYQYSHPATDIYDENSESIDILANKGVITKLKNDKVELLPTEYSQWISIIKSVHELQNGNQETYTYVVKIASIEEYNRFVGDIKRIKEIDKLFN